MIDTLRDFGDYLASSGPGERAERERSRLGADQVAALYERWSGQILGPGVTAEAVVNALGPPNRVDGLTLHYCPPQWPGYSYAFDYDEMGRQTWSGFRRLPEDSLSCPLTFDPDLLARRGVTEAELIAWFGKPIERVGWWPSEDWAYAEGTLTLRHGIVE